MNAGTTASLYLIKGSRELVASVVKLHPQSSSCDTSAWLAGHSFWA